MGEQATPRGERRVRREQHPDQLRWIAQARCLAAALDLIWLPVLLVLPGEPLRVWHANSAARLRLSAHPHVHVRDGVLTLEPALAPALARAIEQAVACGPGNAKRIALPSAEGTASLSVQALDFGNSPDLPVSTVLMLELRESAATEHGLRRLCGEFQLTRREAETALGLVSMGSVEKLARCAGKSVHTVRTQLKAAMQKTGTHTQAGLVALVANRLNT